MPPLRSASLLALSLALAGAGVAPAASQSGWVDPPARGASPSPKVEPPRAEPAARPPAPSASEAPQATAGPQADRAARRGEPTAESRMAREAERETERPARRSVRRPSRRLADTPPAPPAMQTVPGSMNAPAPIPAPATPPARLSDWAGAAQGLAADYLDLVSAPGMRMVTEAPRFYAPRVDFHGRAMTLAAVMADKRNFVRRWPERSYEPRGMRTACNGALGTCIVRALVEFRAANPARHAVSRGLAEVVLEVSFAGPRPLIVSESSRVLRRDAGISALTPASAHG